MSNSDLLTSIKLISIMPYGFFDRSHGSNHHPPHQAGIRDTQAIHHCPPEGDRNQSLSPPDPATHKDAPRPKRWVPAIIRSPVIAVLALSILTVAAQTTPVGAQDQHLQVDGSSSYAPLKRLSLAEPRHFARLDAENTQQAALQVAPAATQTVQSAGKWHGAGYTQEGTCSHFEIFVSVVENKIHGEAVLPDRTYEIEGNLGKDGVFVGQVEFFSIAFAELRGDMGPSSGHGQWHTFKGPNCAGTFEVAKL